MHTFLAAHREEVPVHTCSGTLLFRTVAPYARAETPGKQKNTRVSASFHAGYQRYRVA
jgi:hypothetical protein